MAANGASEIAVYSNPDCASALIFESAEFESSENSLMGQL